MNPLRKGNRNLLLSIILLAGIIFSVVRIGMATAPDPGHNFTESSGGVIQGDLLYGSAADTLSALPKDTNATRYLSNTGTSNNPAWAQVDLAAGVTGILADGNIAAALTGKLYNALTLTAEGTGFTIAGGTTSKTLTVTGDATISGTPLSNPMTTAGDLIYGGASGVATRLPGAAGFLKSTGAATPAWSTVNLAASADVGSSILPTANGGTGLATLTANNVMLGNGAGTPTFVAPGAAGNVLQSNGTTWVSDASGGGFLATQILTDGTTYTPTAGTNNIWIRLVGGGGGGGGCTAAAGCAGGGGGSGGYAEYFLTGVTGTYTYAIGAGGPGNSGLPGANGGSTTFNTGATTITAFGGGGGAATAGSSAIKFMAGGAGGVISTNGHVNGAGSPGGNGMTSTVNTVVMSGFGGSSFLGGGGVGRNLTGAGNAAKANTGSGGGGAAATAGIANAGGTGAAGAIIIFEYR